MIIYLLLYKKISFKMADCENPHNIQYIWELLECIREKNFEDIQGVPFDVFIRQFFQRFPELINSDPDLLVTACSFGNLKIARLLLDIGFDVKKPKHLLSLVCECHIDTEDQDENTQSIGEVIQFLIDNGVDPNFDEGDGETPIHVAIWEENFEAASVLLSNGAILGNLNDYEEGSKQRKMFDQLTLEFDTPKDPGFD